MRNLRFSLASLATALFLTGAGFYAHERNQERAEDLASRDTSIPHFASLRFDEVHLRRGPGRNHRIIQTYQKKTLPVEVLGESGRWKKVRDFRGTEGWIHANQISLTRYAVLRPWDEGARLTIVAEPDDEAAPRAYVTAPSLLSLRTCDGTFCEVSISNKDGYIRQAHLWGVYPGEDYKR